MTIGAIMAIVAVGAPAIAGGPSGSPGGQPLTLGAISAPLLPSLFGSDTDERTDAHPPPATDQDQPGAPDEQLDEQLAPHGVSADRSSQVGTSGGGLALVDLLLPAGIGIAMVGAVGAWQVNAGRRDHEVRVRGEDTEASSVIDDDPIDHPGAPGAMLMGRRAIERGRVQAAIQWFETAIELQPEAPMAHMCHGLALEQLERYDDATEAFRATCALQPDDGRARYCLARTLAQAGRAREAMDQLEPLIDLDRAQTLAALETDAGFDRLRDHPRFQQMVGVLDLPTEVDVQLV